MTFKANSSLVATLLVRCAAILVVLIGCAMPAPRTRIQSDQATREERLSAALVPMNDGETLTVSEPRTDSGPRPVVAQPTPVLVATEPEPTTAAISTAPTPLPRYQPAVARVELTGFNHQWQTWNNCGPATLSMNLSYFGNPLTQADIGAVLRRHEDDKNVSPEELVDFARSQGYHAQLRVNGNRDLMRLLLSNGVPVIVETWLEEHPNDGMGHYRMLTGYDDAEQYWIAYDSYVDTGLFSSLRSYAGIRMEYAETEALWSVFNHTYLLIYTDALAPIVESIYGEKLDQSLMWQQALASAQQSVQAQPNNAYAWFNLGTDLTQLGDYAGRPKLMTARARLACRGACSGTNLALLKPIMRSAAIKMLWRWPMPPCATRRALKSSTIGVRRGSWGSVTSMPRARPSNRRCASTPTTSPHRARLQASNPGCALDKQPVVKRAVPQVRRV
ncbi:MAG: C39 family peptidase [Caldilineaceae bacterium]